MTDNASLKKTSVEMFHSGILVSFEALTILILSDLLIFSHMDVL